MRTVTSTVRNAEGHKRCSKCREWKPEYKFSYHRSPVDKLQSACRDCNQTYIKHAGQRHGLSESEYIELLNVHDGNCWVCHTKPNKASIDHDHTCCPGVYSCGKCVRGILCNKCNMALGLFGDSVEALQSAIQYLGGKK